MVLTRKMYVDALAFGGGGGVPEAPTDGQLYSRRGSDASWQVSPSGSGGGIPEAPIDSRSYGRRNGAWDWVISHTNDIVDGGNY